MASSTITPTSFIAKTNREDSGTQRRKRFLLIAFDFPPRRTSGIYRPTGLAKYLMRLGWMPTVLTVEARKGDLEDRTLLDRIPSEVETVRTRYLDLTRWEEPTANVARSGGALRPQSKSARPRLFDRCLRRFGDFIRSCFYFPDDTAGWVPFGLTKAIELNRRYRFDVLYTTSPPRSSLVIGLLLKKLLRLPWIAEFRDHWFLAERPIRRRLERWLLGLILRTADSVVVVTGGHTRELIDCYRIPAGKVDLIPNGFDEEDFAPNHSLTEDACLEPGYIHLTHFGTVYQNCSGKFFQALHEIVGERPELKQCLRVNIIGYPDDVVRRYASEPGLSGIVQERGFMPHGEAIRAMRSSDCLLLFYANPDFSRLAVAGKTYEYLRIARPILAIAYDGGVKKLIEDGKAGWVMDPEDVEGIKRVLRAVLQNGSRVQLDGAGREEFVAQFRYDRLARKLADVFDRVSHRAR
jgi:glycosyltransferase involved in cell wall biosynthesis